jgi:hypothetical protein
MIQHWNYIYNPGSECAGEREVVLDAVDFCDGRVSPDLTRKP